ncbi:MAG: hypothetical protein HRT50_11635 [Colwellia sp.]|uniref:hypothetical protein n=1 Tax=Colwellia sp. TaxID=56799 RepID=UPI001D7E92C8|nr:hypothetical protein [Colwellia sp.]NQY49731.1 hypothetical protein [Colwellia sp.]
MDFSFNACSNILNNMNDLQLFLLSDSCPEDVKETLLEKQLDLIETLNMNLSLLEDDLSSSKSSVLDIKAA